MKVIVTMTWPDGYKGVVLADLEDVGDIICGLKYAVWTGTIMAFTISG